MCGLFKVLSDREIMARRCSQRPEALGNANSTGRVRADVNFNLLSQAFKRFTEWFYDHGSDSAAEAPGSIVTVSDPSLDLSPCCLVSCTATRINPWVTGVELCV